MELPLKRAAHSALALAALCTAAEAGAIGLPSYSLVDFQGRSATALNDAGQVAGAVRPVDDNGNPHQVQGFLYDGYGPNAGSLQAINPPTADGTPLNGPGNGMFGVAGINASGGMAINTGNGGYFTDGDMRGAVVRNGTATDLPGTDGTRSQTTTYGINDAGTVVGVSGHANSGTYSNTPHMTAFVADATGMHDLGTLGGYRSTATAINNAGQVVGYSAVDKNDKEFWNETIHAFLSDGQPGHPLTDLGTLGGTVSRAFAINNKGDIAGDSTLSDPNLYHAFVRTAGAMHDLGSLTGPSGTSEAHGINDAGQVVGYSSASDGLGVSHAFVAMNGSMYDLNDLVKGLVGWTLTDAVAINNNGQILVNASSTSFLKNNGNTGQQPHTSFLLTPDGFTLPTPAPIPEPTSCALLVAAIAGSIVLKWRRT